MGIIFYFIVFIFGLVIGSFLNCVIYRLALPNFSLKGRSYCPHCKHILYAQDLIPLLSFLILKGKCRYCQKKISLQYPLVEIATGLLFLLIFSFFDSLLFVCFLFLVSCFLIIIFVFDLKHYIIPDKIIFSAIFIVLLFRILELIQKQPYGESLTLFDPAKFRIQNLNPAFAGLGAAAFFLFIFLFSRGRWMGFGDVKLAFLMGLFLGFPNILVALFFAFLIGAIIGIGLILAKRKTLKSEVPFGPFLVTSTFIALFWGEVIINWYSHLFF